MEFQYDITDKRYIEQSTTPYTPGGTVYYSFSVPPGLESATTSTLGEEQQIAVREIFDQIERLTTLTFLPTTVPRAGMMYCYNSTLQDGAGLWTSGSVFFGGSDIPVGLITVPVSTEVVEVSSYAYSTLAHEILHGLGLRHPYRYYTSEPEDREYFDGVAAVQAGSEPGRRGHIASTIMSYHRYAPHGDLFPSGPMLLDVAALQGMYGVGNGRVRRPGQSPDLAADTHYVMAAVDRDRFDPIVIGRNEVRTIVDPSGIDVIDASARSDATAGVRIDLRPGHYSTIGLPDNLAIAFGTIIENVIGGAGDDTFVANQASNVLTGGAGADTYVFAPGDGADIVIDSDGRGQIALGGNTSLAIRAGITPGSTGVQVWTDVTNKLRLEYIPELGTLPGTGVLFIRNNGGALLGANDTIIVDGFDPVRAQQEAGFLNVRLTSSVGVELTPGRSTTSVFTDPSHQVPSGVTAGIREGGLGAYTVNLAGAASVAGQMVRIALSNLGDKLSLLTPGTMVASSGFLSGPTLASALTVVVPQGEDTVSFDLYASGDVDLDQAIELTATLLGEDGLPMLDATNAPVTHTIAIDYDATIETGPDPRDDTSGTLFGGPGATPSAPRSPRACN